MPIKKPPSAAQSKIFESGALIRLLLMIPGNGCCREKDANVRTEIKRPKKWSVRTLLFLQLQLLPHWRGALPICLARQSLRSQLISNRILASSPLVHQTLWL